MRKYALVNSILFLLLLVSSGCEKKELPKTVEYPVLTDKTLEQDTPFFLKAVGVLSASVAVDIKAQVSGILTGVLFEDGQLVEAGELLFTIDPRPFEAKVEEAEAQLVIDQARLRYALDFAETYGTLVGEEYVARLDYEQGVRNVDVSKGAVELDKAALKIAKINLGYTQIRSPAKGYIGIRKYDPGNYVDATFDETLVTVKKITPLTVRFYIPSQYVQEIRENQKTDALYLEAILPNDPSHPLTGTLYLIDNNVNNETGMIILQGAIPNEDEKGWPGQFVRVLLRLKVIENAVLVPQNAIVLAENGNFVFVLDEKTMKVTMKMIGTSFNYKNYTVAEWGIKGDEIVITDGQLNLFDGAKVYIPPKDK